MKGSARGKTTWIFLASVLFLAAIPFLAERAAACTYPEDRGEPGVSVRVIYFEDGSAEIPPAFHAALRMHAEYLRFVPAARLGLVGHTGQAISGKKAVALGERRARAVRKFLEEHGAPPEQLDTASLGDRKPLHDKPQKWNQRVELVYVAAEPTWY